jgi:hypothetical protein
MLLEDDRRVRVEPDHLRPRFWPPLRSRSLGLLDRLVNRASDLDLADR